MAQKVFCCRSRPFAFTTVCVQAVLQNAAFSEDLPLDKIARSVSTLIQDSDLLLSASSLHVGVVLLRSYNNAGQSVSECMLPKALQLAGSALLQVCYTCASIQLYTWKSCQEVMFYAHLVCVS